MGLLAMMSELERSIIVMATESTTVGINVRNDKHITIVNFTSALVYEKAVAKSTRPKSLKRTFGHFR